MADDLALTPRTRQLLLIAADLLFDEGREDLDQDDPNPWGLFDRYPRLVATQNNDWRASRCGPTTIWPPISAGSGHRYRGAPPMRWRSG